jgi:uncharacterized protein (TIGR03067 family)
VTGGAQCRIHGTAASRIRDAAAGTPAVLPPFYAWRRSDNMTRMTGTALLALVMTAGASAQDGLSKELTSLQGTWVITMVDGEAVPASNAEVALTIEKDKYSQTLDGQVIERGTIKVDASKKPIAMDLIITEGNDANKTQLGVLDIGEKTIRFKLNTAGETTRPVDFEPADGYFVFVLTKKAK